MFLKSLFILIKCITQKEKGSKQQGATVEVAPSLNVEKSYILRLCYRHEYPFHKTVALREGRISSMETQPLLLLMKCGGWGGILFLLCNGIIKCNTTIHISGGKVVFN